MSGRKQHYIPQVLLRGFSASPNTKAPPIYVYSRSRGCYRTNTKDTAAEREFYSEINADVETLDDDITEYENQLTTQLASIKSNGPGPIDASLPATVITHLAIRNDHTRKMFTDAGGQLLGAIGEAFSDTEQVRVMMGVDAPYSQSRIKQEIRKTITKKFPGLERNKRAQLEAKLMVELSRNFDAFYDQQKPKIAEINAQLKNSVQTLARNSHVKALGNSLAPELRIKSLSALQWHNIVGDFLLPDCVAIAIQADNSVRPYILTNADELHTVFMPISRQTGIIGTVADGLQTNGAINTMMASCASDFFIYPLEDDEMKSLAHRIGTRTTEVISQLTEEAVHSSNIRLP